MNRSYLPLAILALMSVTPALSGDLNSEGIKAYRAGDYQRAERLYRQALAEGTDNETLEAACNNLAVLYQAQGKDATEFTRKAAELSKSRTPRVLYNDSTKTAPQGSGVLQQPVRESPPIERGSSAQPPLRGGLHPQDSSSGSPPIWVNTGMKNVMTDSSMGVNSPFGGFQRNSRENYGVPGFGYPGGYGSGYSVQTPNGSIDYSDASPIILNAPNGQPVIIRAPGPNTSATQRNPDGGTTTIINRTY